MEIVSGGRLGKTACRHDHREWKAVAALLEGESAGKDMWRPAQERRRAGGALLLKKLTKAEVGPPAGLWSDGVFPLGRSGGSLG